MGIGRLWIIGTVAWMASVGSQAEDGQSAADERRAPWQKLLDNDYTKISLDVRARLELANQDGLDSSDAWTVRTRLGLGTKPFHGFSAFAELENTFSFDDGAYFDVASSANGLTPIADPENTELNRGWLRYQNADWADLDAKAGRQRIILDDSRFVGNVGWRQNEQTFDAARVQSSLGVEGLTLQYAYLWDIRRIFGDQGPPGTRDFDSDSHAIHLHYGRLPGGASVSAFAYLLDFDDSPGNSSDSYGFRLAGSADAAAAKLGYVFSYAYQTDAADNPASYDAHYLNAEGSLGFGAAGTLKLGYELLGSDDGKARFVTPLATAHKFNGFADVFLNNGGVDGLQDVYATYVASLPWELKGHVTYHHFWSDEGDRSLGDEVDFVLKRALSPRVEVLTKGAFFFGTSSGPADISRLWLQIDFKY